MGIIHIEAEGGGGESTPVFETAYSRAACPRPLPTLPKDGERQAEAVQEGQPETGPYRASGSAFVSKPDVTHNELDAVESHTFFSLLGGYCCRYSSREAGCGLAWRVLLVLCQRRRRWLP